MMRRRGWVSFFLVTFVLCAGTWGVSYWRFAAILDVSRDEHVIGVAGGSITLWQLNSSLPAWDLEQGPMDAVREDVKENYRHARYHFLVVAFGVDDNRFFPEDSTFPIILPLWFPALLSALGLLWAWRGRGGLM
jgi:hypothetical protein